MQFENVTVIKKANIYFDGNVTSRTVLLPDGEKKTLGVMLPGEYEFNTEAKEIMEILGGSMDICLAGETEFTTYAEGDRFEVPANSSFKLIISQPTDYCCSYVAE